jgi:MFS transporter, DHA1 family, multidrug resistance protein
VQNGFFLLASLAWNLGLAMTWLAVPLYAYAQGLSNSEIGLLLALPVFVQAPLNLAGGTYTDRIGGRRIVLGSSLVLALAGVWLIFAAGFWMLLAGQLVLVVSRAAFWPATWAMATQLPGSRGVQLGRLNVATNVGHIAGTALCGALLGTAGFAGAFGTLGAVGIAAFVAGLKTPSLHRTSGTGGRDPLAAYSRLLRRPIVHYSILCAYMSALPFSLSVSFYPLLLEHFGHGEETSGVLLALRAAGSMVAGLVAARFVRTGPRTAWPVVCGVAIAAAIGFMPLFNNLPMLALWLSSVGFASGAMTLYFQITMADASGPEERGSALAMGGLGWSLSHLSTPLLMGFIADRYGMPVGFYVVGVLAFGCALTIGALRRWAFTQP